MRFNSDGITYSTLFSDHPSADVETVSGDDGPTGEITIGPYSSLIYTR